MNLFDRTGSPIAYSNDDKHIYLFSGEPVAFLDDNAVFAYTGAHMGWFENGWLRDKEGRCVFFSENAEGGPVKPVKKVKPVKGIRGIKPIKGVKSVKSVKATNSLSWSSLSGEHFFDS